MSLPFVLVNRHHPCEADRPEGTYSGGPEDDHCCLHEDVTKERLVCCHCGSLFLPDEKAADPGNHGPYAVTEPTTG